MVIRIYYKRNNIFSIKGKNFKSIKIIKYKHLRWAYIDALSGMSMNTFIRLLK